MGKYRLQDIETREVKQIRDMSYEVANYLNEELLDEGSTTRWIKGLGGDEKRSKDVRSLHNLLRNLDTEGFNEYSIHTIERYLDYHAKEKAFQREKYHQVKEEYKQSVFDLDYDTRKAISKFITMQCGHSFQAGLQLGMTSHYLQDAIEEDDAM